MAAPITDVDASPATQTLATDLSDQQLRQSALAMAVEWARQSGTDSEVVSAAKAFLAFLKEDG